MRMMRMRMRVAAHHAHGHVCRCGLCWCHPVMVDSHKLMCCLATLGRAHAGRGHAGSTAARCCASMQVLLGVLATEVHLQPCNESTVPATEVLPCPPFHPVECIRRNFKCFFCRVVTFFCCNLFLLYSRRSPLTACGMLWVSSSPALM